MNDQETLRSMYDRLADERLKWQGRNQYYHREVERVYASMIPPGASVLEIGCGLGDLLAALRPSRGIGVDFSGKTIALAKERHPNLRFECMDAHALKLDGTFDYIVVSGLLGELEDIQKFFDNLKPLCHPRTRMIVDYYSELWQPLWDVAGALKLKMPQRLQNWLRMEDVSNLLYLSGFEVIIQKYRHLLPLPIPLLAPLCNRVLANLPGIQRLCFTGLIVARPSPTAPLPNPSCTIVVPCRNERGNIAGVFERTPKLGSKTELIFVDGNSSDGTLEEIEKQSRAHPGWEIQSFSQGRGVGKGDAVRQAFARAKGDVLMILDADLTMPPEDLPKFFNGLVAGRGEMMNGSRLVYPMEKQAMRFLNLIANWFFGQAFSWLLEQKLRDTLCGTKVLLRTDYEKIAKNRAYFGDFDPFGDFDLLFGASKLHFKIVDVPVRYKERVYGETNIKRFRHGWQLLKMCFVALFKLKLQ